MTMHNLLDERLMGGAADALPVGIMILRQGRVVDVNRCLAEWFHHLTSDFVGLDAERAEALGLAVLLGDRDDFTVAGGELERCLHRRRAGLPEGAEALIFEDVTPLVAARRDRDLWRERAECLDPVDPGTGQLSRAAILRHLDEQVSRSRRYGNPLSAIRLTLNPVGELAPFPALRQFAQELRADLRWVDQIGRYGDASLLLVLPETPLAAARGLAPELGRSRACWAGLADFTLDASVSGWEHGDDASKFLLRLDRDSGGG